MRFSVLTSLALALNLALATAVQAQQQPPPSTAPSAPSDAEQQDLMRAVTEAANSTVDMIRVLEAHLKKYPNTLQRAEMEQALAKAAIDNKDEARIVKYGESVLARTPDDVLMLDRVSAALLALGGEENAQKAIRYSRAFENIIDGLEPASGKDAVQTQEDRDRAMGRTLLVQSRARVILGQKEEAERLAGRSFSVFPSELSARAWADRLADLGRDEDAMTHLAEAFVVPDSRAADPDRLKDRLKLGEMFTKLHGSEKGLGDLILAAYDRVYAQVELRRKKLLALDPNSDAADATQFTITGLDGKKVPMSNFRSKVIVFDFWATWCVPCRAQHPLYEEVKQHYKTRDDVVFLSLDTDEDRSLVVPFLAEQMWDSKVYFDDGLTRLLQVSQIPTTLLLNKQGKVSSRMNGFSPDQFVAQLIERIDLALGEQQ
jgi:thiol-disulfide isomerase/thioredoxin